jgi:putative oxidoreductase
LLVGTMLGAVATHLFLVGGSPLPAIILLVVTGVIALGRRQRTMNLLARQR